MNPSSWHNQPSGERHYERSTHRAATAPVPGYPAHPRALMPGYVPQTIDRPDLYFTNASRMTIAHDVRHSHFSPPPPVPPLPHSSYYYTPSQIQHPPPPLPSFPPSHAMPTHPGTHFQRSLTSPPPVPPKPPPPPHPPSLSTYQGTQVTPTGDLPPGPSDENDLAMALALSQSASNQEQKLRDKLSSQEEDDLARALEESLSFNGKTNCSVQNDVMEGPSSISLDAFPQSRPSGAYCDDDEAFARALAMEQERGEAANKATTAASETSDAVADLPRYVARKDSDFWDSGMKTHVAPSSEILSDEAFAQKLALEDGGYDQELPRPTSPNPRSSESPPPPPEYPQHDGRLSEPQHPEAQESHSHPRISAEPKGAAEPATPVNSTSHPITSASTPDLPAYAETPMSSSPSASPPRPPDLVVWDSRQSSSSAESSLRAVRPPRRPTTASSVNNDVQYSNSGLLRPSNNLTRISSMSSLSDAFDRNRIDSNLPPSPLPTSNPNMINVNHFVDKELFVGVSIGFMAPKITAQLVAMQDVMPNIISLPFGRCPPLHLQGPNWRHILKLMARLSGTRLEPTVEALAISKTDLRLRTVIQFVRPHAASPEWRTILYFTLDYPAPRNIHVKNSVNDLPHSYSLSTIPTLLRDSADTPLSKTYTIPASDTVPYPKLPINFPSLAMYLQAALEESRRYMNDSSSGNRKLAKMMQTCYRTDDPVPERGSPERSGVGGLFKKVIGRRGATNKRGGGNEDTYEFVTPFVPGEWG